MERDRGIIEVARSTKSALRFKLVALLNEADLIYELIQKRSCISNFIVRKLIKTQMENDQEFERDYGYQAEKDEAIVNI